MEGNGMRGYILAFVTFFPFFSANVQLKFGNQKSQIYPHMSYPVAPLPPRDILKATD
jgi:hypothetical protein